MKVFISSFGCRVNQYEGQVVREGFERKGYSAVEDHRDADVCVVNTCSVTENADKDTLRLLRRIVRDNPIARLVITGCYASRDPEGLRRLFPQALVAGNEAKFGIPSLIGCSQGLGDGRDGITFFYGRTRAYIKIQDGCNMRCSYCIIPKTRPIMESRTAEDVVGEIRGLYQSGYREFVLCGIRLGRYWGSASGEIKVDLLGLIQRIAAIEGEFRIRLSSIEVTDLTDRFLEGYAATPKTVDYFHVPLQSGSDAVLAAMKRWYGADFYYRRIEAVRSVLGRDTAIFTDFMAGYPTETEVEFGRSLDFAEAVGFSGMHIFHYSPRRGTAASDIGQVYSPRQLKGRLRGARELDQKLRQSFAVRFEGRSLRVLHERNGPGARRGHADNFLEVRTLYPASSGCDGFEVVKIAKAENGKLIADA